MTADDVDVADVYRTPAGHGLVRINMVASLNGSAVDEEGRSGRLGGEGDRAVFHTLRALADGILVGAGTARAEGYRPHRPRGDRTDPAPIIVVSRSLDLDFTGPLFSAAQAQTIVLTCAQAPSTALDQARRAGVVVVAGEREVDLAGGLATLRGDLGLAHLLCEGGPRLNASLLHAGLVDEVCLTLGPVLVGDGGPGLTAGLDGRYPLELVSVLEADGELLCRYRLPPP